MQDRQEDSNQQLKKCPYCGTDVKKTGYRCSACHRSLAKTDQQEWEKTSTAVQNGKGEALLPQELPINGRKLSAIALSLLAIGLLVFVVAHSYRSFSRKDKSQNVKFSSAVSNPLAKTTVTMPSSTVPLRSEVLSTVKLQSAATAQYSRSTQSSPSASERNFLQDANREKKIQNFVDVVLKDLRKKEVLTTHTLRLKSGKDVQCTVVNESDTSLTVRFRGVTTKIEKSKVDRIESRTPESVETELQRLALAQATKIVDEGLVQYGDAWITPAERARRIEMDRKNAEDEGRKDRMQKEAEAARVRARAQEQHNRNYEEERTENLARQLDEQAMQNYLYADRETQAKAAALTLELQKRGGQRLSAQEFADLSPEIKLIIRYYVPRLLPPELMR